MNADKRPQTADREILVSRTFDAPRELVWEVFTDPDHIQAWWGPNGFSTITHEMALKPGGVWLFTMHGPDGRDYPNKVVYIDVVKPERLVYKHSDDEAHLESVNFHVTVTFEAQGEKTKLTMQSVFPTAEERDRVVEEYGALEGAKQTLARLGEYLESVAQGG